MKTSGSFGFISYNSREFLISVLQNFIDNGVFLRCACWFHKSLGKEKNHYHCWVEPAITLETNSIVNDFIELNEDGEKQSIAMRPKCKSDWKNAYLYGIHDSEYLAYKGLEREKVDIISDEHIYLGDFAADIKEAEIFKEKVCLAPYVRLKKLVYSGLTLEEVYIYLRTPFAQLHTIAVAYRQIKKQYDYEINSTKIAKQLNEMGAIEEPNISTPFDKVERCYFDIETGEVITYIKDIKD